MQVDRDISYSLISAVREGRLKRVGELISSFGLSYSQEWSDGYVLLCEAPKNKRTDVVKLLLTNGSKVNSRNENPSTTPLHFAVTNGDIEIVEMLLDRGANIDAKTYGYRTPLHDAIRNGYTNDAERQLEHQADFDAQDKNNVLRSTVTNHGIKIVKMVLDGGANVDGQCNLGNTPLFDAVMTGYVNCVKLLLEYGANVNPQSDLHSETMLHIAAGGGPSLIVEQLLKHGASVNRVNTDFHKQLLYIAIAWRYEKVVKLLLERGANTNAQDEYSKTILHFAVEGGHLIIVEHILKDCPDVNNKGNRSALNVAIRGYGNHYRKIVEKLLQYGFMVNLEYENNCKLLHNTVKQGYLEIVEQLLQCGTDVNTLYDSTSRKGFTPLHVATKNKREEEAKLLISFGADVNAGDIIGATPICYAVENDCREIVEVLLQHGADVNSSDKYGRTALHFTALKQYDEFFEHSFMTYPDVSVKGEIVKLLLHRGANVNAQAENGITTLHAASAQGYVKLVEALLEYNADVNCTDKIHRTPLHLASMNCNVEIVEILLKFGAGIDSKDKHGRTALYIASEKGHLEIVKILLKFGASIDSKDEHGRTALRIASEMLDFEIVKVLLKFGATTGSKDERGRTELHIASEMRDLDILKSLLKFGASVDSKDKHGRTALHIACGCRSEECVVALLEHGSDITIMINCKLDSMQHFWATRGTSRFYDRFENHNSNDYNCYYCLRSYPGYGFCKYCVGKNIAGILKRHIVKVKIANLYASNKALLSISSNDDLSDFENECEKEVECMKSEKVGNSDTSFYDILTKGTSQLAIYAGNETIVQVFRSDDYKIKFPIYATMINCHYRKGERRKALMDQGNKIFHFLFTNFLGIPYDCVEKIFTYLSDNDLRSIMVACKPISVSSHNTDNK